MKKAGGVDILEASFTEVPHGFIAILAGKEELVCVTDGACGFADRLECLKDEYRYGVRLRTAALSDKNSHALRLFIKWTAPHAVGRNMPSVGVEAFFPGMLPIWAEVFAGTGVKVVIQSKGRIDANLAASLGRQAWQVLAAGLKSGYGAEYSYARDEGEVMNALLAGYTGIVLDISNKVDRSAVDLPENEVQKKFVNLPEAFRAALVSSYAGKEIMTDGLTLNYTEEKLARLALIYGESIAWLQYVYNAYFKSAPWPVDFIVYAENSLDVEAHYLLANELARSKIVLAAVELPLDEEPRRHAGVAKELGHKALIRVPAGQEKKTAGWLEHCGALLDIRPAGQSAAAALSVLRQAGDSVLNDIFSPGESDVLAQGVLGKSSIEAAIDNKDVIAGALEKYKDGYHSVLKKYADEQKNWWLLKK